MIAFQETIDVDADFKTSYSFLGDFSNLPEWDPGIVKVEKVTPGILRIGTQFTVYASFFGRTLPMTYELKEMTLNEKVVYVGRGETVEVVDTIEFEESAVGSRIKYKAEFEFLGILSNFEKFFQYLLIFTAREAFSGMKRALSSPRPIRENLVNHHLYKLLLPVAYEFSKMGYQSAKKNWRAVTTNLFGKTAIVTGGSTGIGYETALRLARNGATVVLVSRSIEKLKEARENIRKETGNANIYIEAYDLSLLEETKKFADRIRESFSVIDILVNNAGALFNERTITGEGYEKSIALLLYSPFILTESILPLLKKSKNARIVNVSSGGMYTQKLHVDDFQSEMDYNGAVAYARAKRGLVLLSEYWAETLKDSGIRSYSMHPGWADTEAVRESLPVFYDLTKLILRTAGEGADTVFWLAASEEAGGTTGGFWLDREKQPQYILESTFLNEGDERIFINHLMKLKDKILPITVG